MASIALGLRPNNSFKPRPSARLSSGVMHFRNETQQRERRVTEALASPGFLQMDLLRELRIESPPLIARELDKSLYGRNGDVDLVFATGWNTDAERLYAVEVKVMVLDGGGHFRSEKLNKHNKQLQQLRGEGWHYVYLLDVIVTQPAQSWFHPNAFEGFDNYRKEVIDQCVGHIVLQINAIAHKPETEAGSFAFHQVHPAIENMRGGQSINEIRNALSLVWERA